eukprot:CAMPEP_0183316866 /NCGR_PEP_ID=MMETSP0160_2-20130417/56338_1 /TAXON_ID=2839 ORGANISM="Odontella Sinensis, Strain Grunow 1884" /NCGR_SAMPLE_ID=MMETSP0160_2 /ASSEMBLY_ACC=CAM_ASM_000250 /LENGTH=44 /DNA_ID= /DNA_START= /DNA_END= /DNA_ORIENTATION=
MIITVPYSSDEVPNKLNRRHILLAVLAWQLLDQVPNRNGNTNTP